MRNRIAALSLLRSWVHRAQFRLDVKGQLSLTDCMVTAYSLRKEIYLHVVNKRFVFMSHFQVLFV